MGNGDPRAYETYARLLDRNGNAEAKAALARGERVISGLRTENSTFDSASPDNPAPEWMNPVLVRASTTTASLSFGGIVMGTDTRKPSAVRTLNRRRSTTCMHLGKFPVEAHDQPEPAGVG